jgi:N-acetyl-gamma-glutamyl-phosphate reductase
MTNVLPQSAHSAEAEVHVPATPSSVAVIGGAGYAGALLTELLLRHPAVRVTHISSERLAGAPVNRHLPRLRTALQFCRAADVVAAAAAADTKAAVGGLSVAGEGAAAGLTAGGAAAAAAGVDVAFVCSPHGEAAPVVAQLLAAGARVIDLSADFRLTAEQYATWYGTHPHPDLTPGVYGLSELHRQEIAGAQLIANPGCYPTAALLALAPLRALDLLDVIIDAKSGVSGAGATPSARTHFCSVADDVVAYGLQSHRHYPEIANGIGAVAGAGGDSAGRPGSIGHSAAAAGAGSTDGVGPTLTFVPHLVPLQRGIVETIYVRAGRLPAAADLQALYHQAYADEPFVHVSENPPELKDVVGTNVCRLFATVDERAGRIIVLAAIDNLMKGAAGQAVQNMNLMLGRPESEGLI